MKKIEKDELMELTFGSIEPSSENSQIANTNKPKPEPKPDTEITTSTKNTEISTNNKPNIKEEDEFNYNIMLKNKIIQQIPNQNIGSLELTEEQVEILFEEPKDEDILIRPDGLIYLNWTWYAERLRKAFGIQWQLIPASDPIVTKSPQGKPMIIWGFYLFIKGVCMGYAIGEHIDQREKTLSFGEACESAKSNALMRLCKGIGMSLKLWNKEFVEYWISNYARKDQRGYWEKIPVSELKQKKENFIKAVHALNLPEDVYRKALQEFGYTTSKDVPYGKMTEVYLKLKNLADMLRKEEGTNVEENK